MVVMAPANARAVSALLPLLLLAAGSGGVEDACGRALTFLQDTPFGRGFQKEVWLVNISGSDRNPIGLKRHVDLKDVVPDGKSDNAQASALARRFALAGHEEVRKVESFNSHPNIMVIRDVCWAQMWFTVELVAPLIWTFWEKLPWCSRLDMAGQFLDLLQMLHDKGLIHCDLKADQFGVAASGEVKLIDLDSISRYKTGGALLANKSCSMGAPAMTQCCGRSCMRHSLPQTDCACANGYCPRVSSDSTLVSVVGTMVFQPLLIRKEAFGSLPASLQATVPAFVAGCSAGTMGLAAARRFVTVARRSTEGIEQCRAGADAEVRAAVAKTLGRRIREAKDRCTKRYC